MRARSVLLDSLAHLRLWQKLALLFAAMSVPALLLAAFLAMRISAAAHQARNELEGTRYLQALGGVAAEMVAHRERAYAFLSGDRARRGDVSAQAAQVDHQIALMDTVAHEVAGSYAFAPEWQQIKSQWDRLKTQTEQQTAGENDVAHAALAAQVGRLAEAVGIQSGMSFDPEAQTRVLVQIASDTAPKLRLAAAEMRRYAVHASALGNVAADDRMAIGILRARQLALVADMQNALAETSVASRALLQPLVESATSATNDFYAVVNSKLMAPTVNVASGAIYDAGVAANRALKQVSLSCYEALTGALAARLAVLKHERLMGATLLWSLLAVAVLLIWVINRSMARPLRHAVSVFGHIAAGKYDSLIRLQGTDEAAQVLRVLHRMQGHLQAQIGAARSAAAENARVREALDRATVGVILADRQLRIIYLNDSMLTLLRQHQQEIRKVLTGFDSQQLRGRELESMFADAARARAQLENLQAVSTEDRRFGKLVFRTVTSPVLASDGTRLGTVMEWSERSEETRIETEMHNMLAAVIEGDLSRRLELHGRAGLAAMLGSGVNQLAEGLAQLVGQAQVSADDIHRAAREIASGNANLQQRTQQQSASLEQTASSMEEMTGTVKQNADNAAQANQLARTARNQAEDGGAIVGRAVQAMSTINDASRRIADIIGTIDEIAFQTNLLALNAAVEAARAGEQGRGFAVVASEVRNLAGRSATAAREIKELIADSVRKVEDGSMLVTQSGETLQQIVMAVKRVSDIVAEIAAASREQSSGIGQVNTAVGQMDAMTQQNAALVNQAGQVAESMAQQAQSLRALLERYRLTGATSSPERALA